MAPTREGGQQQGLCISTRRQCVVSVVSGGLWCSLTGGVEQVNAMLADLVQVLHCSRERHLGKARNHFSTSVRTVVGRSCKKLTGIVAGSGDALRVLHVVPDLLCIERS